ncbi:hypothetical protein B0H13DRAFT_889105 [Mycena leptocephala]|nr:hypothetical protein B0H13DRAFT_889105 [Mycena leptocephala]
MASRTHRARARIQAQQVLIIGELCCGNGCCCCFILMLLHSHALNIVYPRRQLAAIAPRTLSPSPSQVRYSYHAAQVAAPLSRKFIPPPMSCPQTLFVARSHVQRDLSVYRYSPGAAAVDQREPSDPGPRRSLSLTRRRPSTPASVLARHARFVAEVPASPTSPHDPLVPLIPRLRPRLPHLD